MDLAQVDRQEQPVVPLWNVSLVVPEVWTTPTGLYLGGLEEDVDDRLAEYDNFHGCISSELNSWCWETNDWV